MWAGCEGRRWEGGGGVSGLRRALRAVDDGRGRAAAGATARMSDLQCLFAAGGTDAAFPTSVTVFQARLSDLQQRFAAGGTSAAFPTSGRALRPPLSFLQHSFLLRETGAAFPTAGYVLLRFFYASGVGYAMPAGSSGRCFGSRTIPRS